MDDSTKPKVTGIGGIFYFTPDPEKTRNWYAEHFGLETNDYGCTFATRNVTNPDEINYLQWSPFKENDPYFQPSDRPFMINYRVQNIEGYVDQLKRAGVQVLDEIETFSYGKFVHILDPDGVKIELWEPIDSELQ